MIIEYTDKYKEELLYFYRHIQNKIPFWNDVDDEKIYDSLFNDVDKYGEKKFKEIKTYIYVNESQMVKGYIQFGEAAYIYREGKKVFDPTVGVIRQIYCCKSIPTLCDNLLDIALNWFNEAGKTQIYSFYHALGMTCAFSNGKLPNMFHHINSALLNKGFTMEHENYVYELKLLICDNNDLILKVENNDSVMTLSLLDGTIVLGKCEIQIIEGCTKAYLNWIYIDNNLVNNGYGTLFMNKINNQLYKLGFKHLLCDTSSENIIAQNYYTKNRFELICKEHSFNLSL